MVEENKQNSLKLGEQRGLTFMSRLKLVNNKCISVSNKISIFYISVVRPREKKREKYLATKRQKLDNHVSPPLNSKKRFTLMPQIQSNSI